MISPGCGGLCIRIQPTSLVIVFIVHVIGILTDEATVIRQFPLTETAQLPLRSPLRGCRCSPGQIHVIRSRCHAQLSSEEAGPHAEPEYPICSPFQKTCATMLEPLDHQLTVTYCVT